MSKEELVAADDEMISGLMDMIGATMIWVGFIVLLGIVVSIPIVFTVGSITLITARLARYRTWAALAFLAILIGTPMSVWQWKRSRYADHAQAIGLKIAAAPKLGEIHERDLPILISGEVATWPPEITRAGCFRRTLWITGTINEWNPGARNVRTVDLPPRYLEFDIDDAGRSSFGDRRRTQGRGPYELWLIDNGQRRLVNVFFTKDDGANIVPSLLLPFETLPLDYPSSERTRALDDFLKLAAGQCRQRR